MPLHTCHNPAISSRRGHGTLLPTLAVRRARRLLIRARLRIFPERGRESARPDKNVLLPARIRRSGRVPHIQRDADLRAPADVELVLRALARPHGVLGRAGNGVDEDLLLVEVYERIRKIFRAVAAVARGDGIDSAGSSG